MTMILLSLSSADHGEDLGEFGIYGEHGTADEPVCRIPMIVRWPGMQKGAVVKGFYDNTDLTPTVQELLGTPMFSDRYIMTAFLCKGIKGWHRLLQALCDLTQCAMCAREVPGLMTMYISEPYTAGIICSRRKCCSM